MARRRLLPDIINKESGQSTVELALVAMTLFMLSLFVIEVGRFSATYVMLANSTREAAHAGSFASVTTDAPLVTAANQASPLLGTLALSNFTIAPAGTDNGGTGRTAGGTITVTTTYSYNVLAAFNIFDAPVTLTSTAQTKVE